MSPRRSRSRVHPTSFSPRLELLELREVPATLVVDSTLDTVANDGVTTLREAIDLANTQPGDDTITFAPALAAGGTATITLDSALPDLNTNIAMDGPGANRLTVSRSTAGGTPDFRVFNVTLGSSVSISALTISGGQSSNDGGGIFNAGTLSLSG